jgi:hypothetical protein
MQRTNIEFMKETLMISEGFPTDASGSTNLKAKCASLCVLNEQSTFHVRESIIIAFIASLFVSARANHDLAGVWEREIQDRSNLTFPI